MTVLARRYATALFEAASESNELDGVRDAVVGLATALEDEKVLLFVLDRDVPTEEKRKALGQVFSDASPTFRKFLELVFDRGREGILPELHEVFDHLDMRQRGEAKAFLETARGISPEELEVLRTKLQGIFSVKIDFDVVQNPELIGGLRVTVNNKRIDASVRTRIQKLKQVMSGAATR